MTQIIHDVTQVANCNREQMTMSQTQNSWFMDVYCPNMTIFDPSPNEERMVATIANMRQPSAESLGQHLDLLSWLMRHGCPPQGLEKSFSRYLTWNYQSIYPSIYLSINLSTSIYRHLNVCVYNCIYIYISEHNLSAPKSITTLPMRS